MNYKFLSIALIACATMSCSGNQEVTDESAETPAAATGECRIAYVEADSIMSQYQFVKDYTAILTRKMENIQSTLQTRERNLQQQFESMQRRYESGGFTSAQELQTAQQNLQAEQQNLQALNERLMTDFNEEQIQYNTALRDSLQRFIVEFNSDHRYDYILMRAGDNMLYANPHYDVTNAVISGLNEKYNPSDEFRAKLGD